MRLSHYVVVLVVIAALGIWVVGLHVERMRAGHRIHRLEIQRRELLRQRRELELRFERDATPEKLRARARKFKLDPGGEVASADRP